MGPSAKEIFQDALDIAPAERAAWVASKCTGDPDLLARVTALLDAHAEATRIERGSVAKLKPAPPPLEEAGAIIDWRYEIISVLGEGGFGVVYRARQTSPIVREVALKILRTGLDSHQVVARFDAERQTLALMDHPGIAHVYDAGETANGRPYIAMEFVDGEPITKFCETHQLGLDARLRLIEQVCMAVQHAHTKGIIHRDLKPTNILVTLLDGEPFPTVIDFGIAKAVDPEASALVNDGMALTQEFQVVGTPQYMSPEQATRRSGWGGAGIDTRSDVYSIGTVLYELIAGVPPFDPAELRKVGFEGVLKMIRERTPSRPSTRLLTESSAQTVAATTRTFGEGPERLSRRVAGDVDWIVMRTLEKEPARRYQSAADLAADIRRHLAHEPVLAGPPSAWYSARKFIRRHRVAVTAAAVVAIALVATAAISLESARRARAANRVAIEAAERATKAEAVAVENEKAAERELKKATAVVSFTQVLLQGVAPGVARGRDTTLLRELLYEAAKASPQELKDEPMIDLVVRDMIANVMSELGEVQAAYDLLRPAWDATAHMANPQDAHDRLSAGATVASLLGDLGRVDEAEKLLRDLIAEYDRLGIGNTDEAIETMAALASNSIARNDYAEAKSVSEKAIAILLAEPHPDPVQLQMSRDRLANALSGLQDYDGAIKIWEENLADTIKRVGEDSPDVISNKTSLGDAYEHVGRSEEAEKYFRGALEANRKLYEAGNPYLLTSLSVYGDFLNDHQRFEEAAKLLEEAKATATLKLPPENGIVLVIDARLGQAYSGLKRYAEAIALDKGVIEMTLKLQPVEEQRLCGVLVFLTRDQLNLGHPQDALDSVAAYAPKEGWPENIGLFYPAMLKIATCRAHLELGELPEGKADASAARELLIRDGREKGRYMRRVEELEAAIATATTRPTTIPSARPTTAPVTQPAR